MKIYKYILGAMGTNSYLLVDEATSKALLVDPADDAERLKRAIADKSCHLVGILLTHGHFDHVMALEELRTATKAPLLLHREEEGILYDNENNLFARFSDHCPTFAPAERRLSDGEAITVGQSTLTVCHTPGHTPGSICLIDKASASVISGDTLFRESIGRYDFPGGDYGTLMSSLQKLLTLCSDADYRVYPGHGPSTRINHEKEHNLYLL